MAKSFTGPALALLAAGRTPKGFPTDLVNVARRKLYLVVHASQLDDLRSPPGNRLEALKGDRRGQYSIRINDQFRVCFRWTDGRADDIEITDYH